MMWTSVNLEDLFHIGSSRRVLKSQWQESGIPFYRGREITKLSKDGVVYKYFFI
jgi:type I restriction enzyme S subunit